jgi:hypothetical protein
METCIFLFLFLFFIYLFFFKGNEYNGKGTCIWNENKEFQWIFRGELINEKPKGTVKLVNEEKQISFVGRFVNGERSGKCIYKEKGKEFNIYYENGHQISKERTFQGIRIMIIGSFLSLLFILLF